MRRTTKIASVIAAAILTVVNSAGAQTVTRASGGTVKTELLGGIAVNKNSSLTREWITVNLAMPATFTGATGVRTVYKPDRVRGEYNYEATIPIEAKEPLVALSIHFLLFDIWGRHVRTLSFTEVSDIESSKTFSGSWRAFSENDVAEFYASIAYVARARTKSGRVVIADTSTVLVEAQKFSSKFSVEDLEPKSERK